MNKWCLILVLGILSNEALCFSYRNKRQAESNVAKGQGQSSGQEQGQLPDQGQQDGQGGGQSPGQDRQSSTSAPAASTTTTQSVQTVRLCMTGCPVTSEYNPVCGSNGVTYDNPGRLSCAQACGVNVNLQRASRC